MIQPPQETHINSKSQGNKIGKMSILLQGTAKQQQHFDTLKNKRSENQSTDMLKLDLWRTPLSHSVKRATQDGKGLREERQGDLPLTLASTPGILRICSTVSTWFLLQARCRSVSPTFNSRKERKRERNSLFYTRVCPPHRLHCILNARTATRKRV